MYVLTYILQTIFNKLKNKKDIEAGDCCSYKEEIEEVQEVQEVHKKRVELIPYNNYNNYYNYNYNGNYNNNFISDLREIVIHKITV